MPLTDGEIEEFLGRPNIAVVATVRPSGQPHAVPIWYDYDGEKSCCTWACVRGEIL